MSRLTQALTTGPGRRGLLTTAALAAMVAGVVMLVVALSAQKSAPAPAPSASGNIHVPATPQASVPSPASGHTAGQAPSTPPSTQPPPALHLPHSRPATISIPAIDVRSDVIPIGKDADGALAVPQPGPDLNKVAWYDASPTPGQLGPSVLEGHIDSVDGPSIFFRLGALRPGDTIGITREDGSTAVFTVNAVRSYATHADFPRAEIFGADLDTSTIRLITCGNFDAAIGHYLGNTVVFAHLTSVRG